MNRMNVAFVVIAVMLMAGCKKEEAPLTNVVAGQVHKGATDVPYTVHEECLRGVLHYVTTVDYRGVSLIRAGDIYGRAIVCSPTNVEK